MQALIFRLIAMKEEKRVDKQRQVRYDRNIESAIVPQKSWIDAKIVGKVQAHTHYCAFRIAPVDRSCAKPTAMETAASADSVLIGALVACCSASPVSPSRADKLVLSGFTMTKAICSERTG